MAGTAFWPTRSSARTAAKPVTGQAADRRNAEPASRFWPRRPDFVAAQLPILMGPDSKVAKREDFANLGIGNYLSPGICAVTHDTGDVHGSRD